MANIKSAVKRLKTSKEKQLRNKSVKTGVHTARRQLIEAIAAGDKSKSDDLFRQYCSIVDKATKKGVIKRNTADRRKSRAAARISALAG